MKHPVRASRVQIKLFECTTKDQVVERANAWLSHQERSIYVDTSNMQLRPNRQGGATGYYLAIPYFSLDETIQWSQRATSSQHREGTD